MERSSKEGAVVAIVENLFDIAPLREAARRLEVPLTISALRDAVDLCRREAPRLIVVDLALSGVLELLHDPALRAIPTLGFYPHVDQELRRAALQAGVGQALPRSAFFGRLDTLLAPSYDPRP